MTYASRVQYPLLLVLAEKDAYVSNEVSRKWFSRTSSSQKTIKMMAGAYHDVAKEPNNDVLFESML